VKPGHIILLCGSSGAGKTTTLLKLLELLKSHNLDCRGVLCPPGFTKADKTHIEIMDVASNEKQLLAELNRDQTTRLATTTWKLDPAAVDWGNQVLTKSTPCDVLFVDEMGPLEYERGEGLTEGFKALETRAFQLSLVTIRPSLLEKARPRWPDAQVIQVARENQAAIIDQLIKIALGAS